MEPHGYIVDINMFLHRIGREHVTAYLGLPLVQISLSTNLNINKLSTYLKLWYRSMQLDFFFLNACSISNGQSSFGMQFNRKNKFPTIFLCPLRTHVCCCSFVSLVFCWCSQAKFWKSHLPVYKMTLFHPSGSLSRGI